MEEVSTDKGKQTVEIVDAPNAVIPELRIGSHNPIEEDLVRHAILCYNEHNNHNIQRRNRTIERIKWWNQLEEEEKQKIRSRHPDFVKKLELNPVVDAWSDHCLTIAATVTNMSVSSTTGGKKPLVDKYLEPHTRSETIERTKRLPEDEVKKGPLGGIFDGR